MARKDVAPRTCRVDFSNVDILTEEAKNIDGHRPAMITTWIVKYYTPRIRIVPSKLWSEAHLEPDTLSGTISHESLHICIAFTAGSEAAEKLDKLPLPKIVGEEMYVAGVYGWAPQMWNDRGKEYRRGPLRMDFE